MATNEQVGTMLLTIAKYNPYGVNLLADKYGYPRPSNDEMRVGFLLSLIEDKGNEALADIAMIHPEKDLIIEAYKSKNEVKQNESRSDGSAPVASIYPQYPLQATVPIVPPQATRVTVSSGSDKTTILIIIIVIILIFIYGSKTSKSN